MIARKGFGELRSNDTTITPAAKPLDSTDYNIAILTKKEADLSDKDKDYFYNILSKNLKNKALTPAELQQINLIQNQASSLNSTVMKAALLPTAIHFQGNTPSPSKGLRLSINLPLKLIKLLLKTAIC
ncbi:hypothetical protein [Piscirickettsia litoralis]|nr:hypothetical protein [Piscirickettsia litoralis]